MTRPAYWIFAVLSLLIAVSSLRGLIAPLPLVMPNMAHFLTEAPWRLWGHILGGPLALANCRSGCANAGRACTAGRGVFTGRRC